MTNKELQGLLVEAADMLANETVDDFVLNEAAGSSEGDKLVKDVKDAIDKQDEKKLREALTKFKKWFLTADPDGNHQKIRLALVVLYALISASVFVASSFAFMKSGIELVVGENKTKWILVLAASISSYLLALKGLNAVSAETDKVQSETIDEFINKYEKKVEELKKALEDFEGDKTKKEYKALAKSYREAVQWLDWFKQRKDQITKSTNIRETKQELKDAKKSKDKQKIAEAKAKYKAAKSLIESALEILGDEESLAE